MDYHQSAIFRRNIKMLKHILYIIYQNKFAFHRRVGKVVGSIVQHRNVMMQDKKIPQYNKRNQMMIGKKRESIDLFTKK